MPAVTRQLLRERRRSLAWWVLGTVALVALTVGFYPSVRDVSGLSDYARNLPESLRGLFAGGEIDLVSAAGYLNSQVFAALAPLLLLIFAIGLGAAAVAGEEERGTLDLLLAHPVARARFVCERYLAIVVLIAALSAALAASVLAGSALVDLEVGAGRVLAASAAVGLLALLFASLALAVGCVAPGRGRAIALTAAVAIGSWVLDGLAPAVAALEGWRPLSPFYQAIATDPLREGPAWDNWALLLAASLVLLAVAARGLERRDVLA